MTQVTEIRCGQCGVDTAVPVLCPVCLAPLVRTTGDDGAEVLTCPHTPEGEPVAKKKTTRAKSSDKSSRDVVPGFGEAVRQRMKEAGLTTTQLGERAGVHQTAVSKLILETRAPSLLIALKIALALGTTLDVLIEEAQAHAHE